MTLTPHNHNRRSLRLPKWNYSADGAYFVTLCTRDRKHLFGDVVDDDVRLNALGETVAETWRWLPSQYPYVVLDEWCVMPNHLHGILVLTDEDGSGRSGGSQRGGGSQRTGGSRTAPTRTARKPLGRLIGAFKTVSTKHINRMRNDPGGMIWQRDFWERVVRDDTEMDRIRVYIRNNPATWTTDALNQQPVLGDS